MGAEVITQPPCFLRMFRLSDPSIISLVRIPGSVGISLARLSISSISFYLCLISILYRLWIASKMIWNLTTINPFVKLKTSHINTHMSMFVISLTILVPMAAITLLTWRVMGLIKCARLWKLLAHPWFYCNCRSCWSLISAWRMLAEKIERMFATSLVYYNWFCIVTWFLFMCKWTNCLSGDSWQTLLSMHDLSYHPA